MRRYLVWRLLHDDPAGRLGSAAEHPGTAQTQRRTYQYIKIAADSGYVNTVQDTWNLEQNQVERGLWNASGESSEVYLWAGKACQRRDLPTCRMG